MQEPGRPLFVSLLLYLDGEWRREWDAETLFLDSHADVGLVVRRPSPASITLLCGTSITAVWPDARAAHHYRYAFSARFLKCALAR